MEEDDGVGSSPKNTDDESRPDSPQDTDSVDENYDGFSTHYVQATAVTSHQVDEEKMDQVIAETQAMYDRGKPLFTKEVLRQIAEAFDNILRGSSPDKTVRIVALDGFQWEFQIAVGDVYAWGKPLGPDVERFLAKPCPDYQCIEDLTDKFYLRHIGAFLPISISHQIKLRNKTTGAMLLPRGITTRAEAEEMLRNTRRRWQAGEHFGKLQALLEKHASIIPRNVRKVVAFACCAFAHHEEHVERYLHQHALVLYIRDFFAARAENSQPISCYAQDPAYSPVDEEALQAFDVKVVDDPGGFVEVDETSVVLSISPNIPVRQIIADIARPAMMIWDTVPDTATNETTTDTPALRVIQMIQSDYVDIGFPAEELPPEEENFGDISIYFRKEEKPLERQPSML